MILPILISVSLAPGQAERPARNRKQEIRMTDDFAILSDAELDQVSGGDNPYAPPPHTHYHGPGWYHEPQPSGVSAITPFRNVSLITQL
jgi:hypothetical protein